MTPQEIAAFFGRVVASPTTDAAVKQQIVAFMTQGIMPTLPEAQRVVQDALQGTQFADAPGTFYTALRSVPATDPSGFSPDPRGQASPSQAPLGGGDPGSQVNTTTDPQTIVRNAMAAATQGANGGRTTPNPGAGYVDEFGAQLTGPGAGTSQRPTEAGIASQVAREQARVNTPGLPTAGGGFSAPLNAGDRDPTQMQGMALARDDDRLIRFALQQAGLNPDRMTSFSRIVGRALVPLLRSARSAFGVTGSNTEDQLPDFIRGLSNSLTTKGGNFFGQLQQLGEGAMGSDYLAGIANPEDQAAFIQSLLPARYAGRNPMIQQSVSDTFDRQLNAFKDQDFYSGGASVPTDDPSNPTPVFIRWLQEQRNVDPITRRIFGIR